MELSSHPLHKRFKRIWSSQPMVGWKFLQKRYLQSTKISPNKFLHTTNFRQSPLADHSSFSFFCQNTIIYYMTSWIPALSTMPTPTLLTYPFANMIPPPSTILPPLQLPPHCFTSTTATILLILDKNSSHFNQTNLHIDKALQVIKDSKSRNRKVSSCCYIVC